MITLTFVVYVFTKSNVFTLNIRQIFYFWSRCTNYILLVITFEMLILKLRFLCKCESALNYLQNEWSCLYFWRNWNFGLWKWLLFWIWSQKLGSPWWDWWGFFSDVNSHLSEATDQVSALYYFVWGYKTFRLYYQLL